MAIKVKVNSAHTTNLTGGVILSSNVFTMTTHAQWCSGEGLSCLINMMWLDLGLMVTEYVGASH